jgi:hypothetical protein
MNFVNPQNEKNFLNIINFQKKGLKSNSFIFSIYFQLQISPNILKYHNSH